MLPGDKLRGGILAYGEDPVLGRRNVSPGDKLRGGILAYPKYPGNYWSVYNGENASFAPSRLAMTFYGLPDSLFSRKL